MRRNARMRKTAMATLVGAGAVLAPASYLEPRAHAEELAPRTAPTDAARMQGPALIVEESGTPPRGQRLRAIVSRALDDSIEAWKQIMESRAVEIASVNLRFVSRLEPTNCYGLYAGEGPAYCSGNQTVFVGTREANRLMARFGPQGEAGITFLIGHEMGHHIQNLYGRFHLLSHVIARAPASRLDLVRRFELEADCYAGVWINASPAWARSARFRSDLLKVLASIGDDTLTGHDADVSRAVQEGAHGTSEQRTRWFLRGAETGNWRACNVFSAASP